jgi:hypothetical protein
VLWIDQRSEGVYADWYIPKSGGHFSYHRSGAFHFKVSNQIVKYEMRPAFDKIRGLVDVLTFYVPKLDPELAKLLPKKRNKPDITIIADMANLNERYLQVRVWLMEPRALEALNRVTPVKPDDSENPATPWVKVFEETTPWLVIAGDSSRATPYGDYNVFSDEP